MSKFRCPVCNNTLQHERVDDGYIIHDIAPNGEVIEIANKSSGYDKVYCTNDSSHELNDELYQDVIDLVN